MLYKKNIAKQLDNELFKNPTSEYRAAPFWAWNCELNKEELLRQIECLKDMGLGGFHMHTRSGMATEYLSEEFMELVKACTKKAEKEDMYAWLYDEDRWPSGAAGGYVTKNPVFRQRNLLFTVNKRDNIDKKEEAIKNGTDYFLSAFDIELDQNGYLKSYKRLKENKKASGICRYAYVIATEPTGWFNGQSYIDTLNKKAVEKFIEITHEEYKKAVGEYFGKTVPAIFTDEPQFSKKQALSFAESDEDILLPWTNDFEATFYKTYGFDILDKLPELLWDLKGGEVSKARYDYHDHVCERFTDAFSDTIGKWCAENGIYLTGHVYEENTLRRQAAAVGEVMRAYRSFGIAGVDMLCNLREYDTVKQAESASHQYGQEGVLSELYGVTNWDFDFRGHKFQGDWQAALGVTVRVPHLSWVSMKGSAKRDYPASINYQSPWYKEYKCIEDHFARLATALTRGKPRVNVGIIHPIESYWLNWGPAENTSDIRKQLDDKFADVIEWMLFSTLDFDFISESCIPSLCGKIDKTVAIGEMNYSAIVVPGCITLRKTTVEMLQKFEAEGGKVIFMGECPKYVDAEYDEAIEKLYNKSQIVSFEKLALLNALKDERDIEIRDEFGETPNQFLYQMRDDGNDKWLFIANARPETMNVFLSYNAEVIPINVIVKIKGEYTPKLYNTITGDIENIAFKAKNGFTEIPYGFFANDSLLLKLMPLKDAEYEKQNTELKTAKVIDFKHKVSVNREEENVCVLDIAEYSLDDAKFCDEEEILRIDDKIRAMLDWPRADGQDTQPWAIEEEKITHFVNLKFTFESEAEIEGTYFCSEELSSLNVNGENVQIVADGYFTDKSITKYRMPKIRKGVNTIIAKLPIGQRLSLENCYLIGEFDVSFSGCDKTLSLPAEKIAFGDITSQGLPFYGGNLTYTVEIDLEKQSDIEIIASKYAGTLIKVSVDGNFAGNIIFEPYKLNVKNLSCGKHTVSFKLFGNRVNTFGALHNCGRSTWYGPSYWYSKEDSWCYEYNLKKTGIYKSPVIKVKG